MLRSALAAALTALLLTACAVLPSPDEASRPAVAVTRAGDAWTAVYDLDRDAPAWGFFRSSLISGSRRAWRLEQWRVVTPGVVLERIGTRDVMRSLDGGPVPRRVEIAFSPVTEPLEADYGVLTFTDGSVALPSGIFDVFPLASAAAAATVPQDLNGHPLETGPARVTWRDAAGPVLFRGSRQAAPSEVDAQTYVLFGDLQPVQTPRLTVVADPQLPAWIRTELEDFAPRVIDLYGRRLGPGQSERPTVMMSWAGADMTGGSMTGSVLPGLIVMNFEGQGVLQASTVMRTLSRWFIAHEGAHFWLGQTVRYEAARDAWITEGGADLMAVRALQALDPAYDARAELQKSVDDCVRLADQPLVQAAERGEHRAFYACGAVFGLVAEAAQNRADGGDWFDFLRPLIDAERADGVLTRAEWLAALDAASGDPGLRRAIDALLDVGAPDPASALATLLTVAGVPHRREAGRVVLE